MENHDDHNSKKVFTEQLSIVLKKEGYRRKRNYWYFFDDSFVFCIQIQGSQWDKNDYYVNIGARNGVDVLFPTELKWTWFHRCKNNNGEQKNISLTEFIKTRDAYYYDYANLNESIFLNKYRAIKIGDRWMIN